jgi:hypothetical protein
VSQVDDVSRSYSVPQLSSLNFQLRFKAYATSKRGPKRIVYLLAVEDGDMFLLFYRGKNDAIGKNASMSNPTFRAALDKYLALLEADIAGGYIEELVATDD